LEAQRKKILLVIPNLSFGGAQRVFYEQVKLLSEHHDVVECVFNMDLGCAYPSGREIVSLDVKAGTNFIDKIFRFWQRVSRLKKVKKKFAIELSISHLEGADLVNVLSRGLEQVVCWVHGSKRYDENISGFIGWLRHRFLIPFVYRSADRVITVSQAIKTELIEEYGSPSSRIFSVYNFFDSVSIENKKNEPLEEQWQSVFAGEEILITSGRLALQKNQRNLIGWFSELIKYIPCKLIILGDGELRDELINLSHAKKLKIYHRWTAISLNDAYDIYFLGYQENPFKFISKATIFVLPSSWEGFPLALGEAMICGVPVVAADCPTGPNEMLSSHTDQPLNVFKSYGVLMPLLSEDTIPAWIDVFRKLLEDPKMRSHYREKSLQRGKAFSKQQLAPLWLNVIDF
jgi:glycosyltransferase involved in cell wall biosynthesis